jgi:peptidoglycan/LPS O-acetylase OafA/YrhL
MPNTSYRREIDGLRAIAVLVIVFFHMQIPGFQGGFIGVDVFFVVSGFLITQIILSSLNAGEFSFRDFYVRRVTRIIPALAVTVAAVLLCSLYLQLPQKLEHTALQSIYALLSVSNFFFWSQASYWATTAESYALLHTWSLGVEEQFYIAYPLMLFAAHRLGGSRGVVITLLLTFGISLYASEIATRVNRDAAFFFSPLRFYEFALGGLGTFLAPRMQGLQKIRWLSSSITLLGIFLILASTVLFSWLWPLPGTRMLIPLFGALLVILAGPSPSANILLGNPLMSWLGKVSYSLYLVHWPIIVFYRQYFEANPSLSQIIGLFLGILVTAELLNRFVERRFRLSRGGQSTAGGMPASAILRLTAVTVLIILVASGTLVAANGWPSRIDPEVRELAEIDPQAGRTARKQYVKDTCTPAGELFCGKRIPGKRTILLLADSRGPDIFIALREAYPQANVMVSYAPGCPPTFSPVLGSVRFKENCPEFNQSRLKAAVDAPQQEIIFLAADISTRSEKPLHDTVKRLRAAGKTVYLLGEFRLTRNSPIDIAIGSLRFGDENYLDRFLVEEPFKLDGEYANSIEEMGAVYVSNKPFFFDGKYHLQDRQTGNLLTEDGIHLTTFGAKKFGQYLRENYPLPKTKETQP